jgi:hypothetical protein
MEPLCEGAFAFDQRAAHEEKSVGTVLASFLAFNQRTPQKRGPQAGR